MMVFATDIPMSVRTYTVPPQDPPQSGTTAVIPAGAVFQLRQRDTLDFTVDFRRFLTSLGPGIVLSSVVFTQVGATTQAGTTAGAPSLVGNGFTPDGIATLVVQPNPTAGVGDIYTIDCAAVTSISTYFEGVTLPARKITRRIAIIVVAG